MVAKTVDIEELERLIDDYDTRLGTRLEEGITALIQEVRELRAVGKLLAQEAVESLRAVGGCDHDVNICVCGLIDTIDEARRLGLLGESK